MSPFVIGLLCALIVGVGATLYFWGVRRRHDESAAGVLTLSAMRWREFAGLVADMLLRRGYSASEQHPLGSSDQSDIVLQRDGVLCVVSCKHGSAYRLGGNAVAELANSVRLNGAGEGIMVTPGTFAPEALQQARQQRIELIDGHKLWPEIAPLVPEPLRKQVEAAAAARAKRSIGFVWLAAVAFGAAATLLSGRSDEETLMAPSATTAAPTGPAAAKKTDPASAATPEAAPTEQQAVQRRRDAASAIAALPNVERAVWSTQSTLSLDVSNDRADLWDSICGIIDRYEELRSTRVQINPPPGSDAPVRFKQCHAY